MQLLKGIWASIMTSSKSKRVLATVVTAFIVAVNQEYVGLDDDTCWRLALLAVGLVVSDSIRPVDPGKYQKQADTNGEA